MSETHKDIGVYSHLRQLISTVDNLRDVGLNQYIRLPSICVVGTQSAGKSSLLEAIVGMDFLPRGDGVVTRRPLEMRLIHTTGDQCKTHCIFEGDETKYSDFSEVKKIIAAKTDEIAGSRKGIVDKPIKISILGNEIPDLTLIDLPGITRVPLKDSDQTEDIEKVTRDMVMRYASDKRTVILAVIPANQDISCSDALQIARSIDPEGIRTLGVITKVDIMDSGTDAGRMLQGADIPLRLGYVGVKLRSQLDIKNNLSIAASIVKEQDFFNTHQAYRSLSPNVWGTKTLTAKLAQILFRHIKHCLPDIKAEINSRRNIAATRLSQLGNGPPQNDAERVQLLWSLVTDFCEILKNTVRGKFDRRLSAYFDDNEALSGGAQIRQIMNELLQDKMKSDMTRNLSNYDIDRAVRQHEGDSLPGFPSHDTFEYLLLPHLSEIQQPVYDCLDQVSDTLDMMATFIILRIFQRFPALGDKVTSLSQDILREQKDLTKDILDKIIMAETGYLFTNNEEYLFNHAQMGKMLPNTSDIAAKGNQPPPAPQFVNNANNNQQSGEYQPQNGDQSTPASVNSYSIKGLQQMTSNLMQNTKTMITSVADRGLEADGRKPVYSVVFIDEIRNRLNSYFSLVIKNTRETVPKTIGYFLVRSLQDILQYQLYQTLTQADNLDELLGEPPEIKAEREELKLQRRVLEGASAVLQRDLGGFASSGGYTSGFDEFLDRDIMRAANPTEKDPVPVKGNNLNGGARRINELSTSASGNVTPQSQSIPVDRQSNYNLVNQARDMQSSSMMPDSMSSMVNYPSQSQQQHQPTPQGSSSVPKRRGLFG